MTTTKVRIGPEDHGRTMSLEEFAEAEGKPGFRYELAGGVIQVVEVPGLPHGHVVHNLVRQIVAWELQHPGAIVYHGGGGECALRLPGMRSERHPDRAIYLTPAPDPVSPWDRWIPDIVVEVVSEGGERRDYDEKRREYLAAGVREYWIVDRAKKAVLVLVRTGDVFRESTVADAVNTPLLPGLAIDVPALFASPPSRA